MNNYLDSNQIRKLAYTGLMTALVLISTWAIKIPVPFTDGYIHLGDSMIFIAAILLGWKYGAFAAGVGSALADIIGGYAHWAIPTLIIKALMGAIVGICVSKKNNKQLIVSLSAFFAIGFAMFNVLLKSILTNNIVEKSIDSVSKIVTDLELESHSDLISLTSKVQTQLLIVTLVIPCVILLSSLLIAKYNNVKFNPLYIFGFVISGTFMVFGYYIASYIMSGSYIIPIFSIPWNIVQFVLGLIIAELILIGLDKSNLKISL
jgi:uncharacterized membrane protein